VLNKAGYVRSTRGAQGGYQLVNPPAAYTVGMILRLTEGNLAPVDCLSPSGVACDRSYQCASVVVWQKIYEAVNNVIDDMTLADLLEIEREKKAAHNYSI
ncbi:MAG: Rrf2 family transcriptional regulator, partial [Lachnospiraceae bacterium]|nr:Rrf2 family transcriptional regulator [Lachnospiraceae bacterium]